MLCFLLFELGDSDLIPKKFYFWAILGVFKTVYNLKFEPLGSSSEVYGLVGSEQALGSSTERSTKHVASL